MILSWRCRRVGIRRLFRFTVAVVLVYGTMQPSAVQAETKIIPEAMVIGRYNSNIYNRPKQLLAPGTETGDFVTVAGGGVEVLHETRDLDASLRMGGTFNTFLENTNRNFAAVNVGGHVDLDRWVDQYIRGAGLSVDENFRYTPEPPGFLVGTREVRDVDDSFFHGVQGFRASSFINTTTFKGNYPVSRDLSLAGGYTFGLRRFGRIQGGDIPGVGPEVSYFDTMTHTWFGGPRYKLTPNDTIGAMYRQGYYTQERASDGGSRTFSTNLVTLAGEYSKVFPEWRLMVLGGITFVEPAGRSFPSGSVRISTKPERDTVISLQIAREGRPSYFLQGGANINNRAVLGLSHIIYERLKLDGMVGYAYTELLPDTRGAFKYLTASSKLTYKLTRTITGNIHYIYSNVDNDASSVQYQVSRHQVGFMLTAAWDLLAGDWGIGAGSGEGI